MCVDNSGYVRSPFLGVDVSPRAARPKFEELRRLRRRVLRPSLCRKSSCQRAAHAFRTTIAVKNNVIVADPPARFPEQIWPAPRPAISFLAPGNATRQNAASTTQLDPHFSIRGTFVPSLRRFPSGELDDDDSSEGSTRTFSSRYRSLVPTSGGQKTTCARRPNRRAVSACSRNGVITCKSGVIPHQGVSARL